MQIVRDLVTRHLDLTASRRAQWILDNWQDVASRFIKIFPHEFKRVLGVGRSQHAYVPVTSTFVQSTAAERMQPAQVRNNLLTQVGQVLHG
jgi:glutamate synthase domain-containing protein 3